MIRAKRMDNLPPYIFANINRKLEAILNDGVDVINLGIGDPDLPTPDSVISEGIRAVRDPENHKYPSFEGLEVYRQAVASYYNQRFEVNLDHKTEVLSLIGSKEGIAHISLCYVNPRDLVLTPDPGYPTYARGAILAGGENYKMPLLPENDYLPDLDAIPEYIAKSAKIMFLNYPNNPTGAIATKDFFKRVVEFAKENKVIVCHDLAYGEIGFDGYRPISFLETPGAKDVGIEFGSLSKPYNMAGWRIGYAVGNKEIIDTLRILKTNLDTGIFMPIQLAAAKALTDDQSIIKKSCSIYQNRRDLVVNTLNRMGWNLSKSKGTFYVWAPVPKGYTSESFTEMVLEKAGVVVTPGNAFGQFGEGYFRISLTVEDARLKMAMKRVETQLKI